MKKIILSFLTLSLILVLGTVSVKAQEDFDDSEMVSDQLVEEVDLEALEAEEKFLPTPGSPWYFLQGLREKVEDLAARTPEKKANVALRHARRRLLEMHKLTLEKRGEKIDDKLEKLQEKYEEKLKKAEERAEKAGEKADEIKAKILERREEQNRVIERVLEKAPESARPALQRVLERHEENTERFMERFPKIEQRIESQLERRRERIEEQFERKEDQLEEGREGIEERLEQSQMQEPAQMEVAPKLDSSNDREGKVIRQLPKKPSLLNAPKPAVSPGKKVLGVWDAGSIWEMGWEMFKALVL